MARFLVVRIDDESNPSAFAKVRRNLHKFSQEQDINIGDFGTNFELVTYAERKEIESIYNKVMNRAKDKQREIDSSPRTNKPGKNQNG